MKDKFISGICTFIIISIMLTGCSTSKDTYDIAQPPVTEELRKTEKKVTPTTEVTPREDKKEIPTAEVMPEEKAETPAAEDIPEKTKVETPTAEVTPEEKEAETPTAEVIPKEEETESPTGEENRELKDNIPDEGGLITIGKDGRKLSADSSGFVMISDAVPDVILEIRYYSTYNFIGDRIDGYEEPVAFLTKEAAAALRDVSDELKEMGYRLKIFDAYRPQSAVDNFVRWAKDLTDTRMKKYFYPELNKTVLFKQGYIASHSGHSRGSTVDLTLFDMDLEKEVDMGGTFDYFGERSHPDYSRITEEQYANRMLLREVMVKHGFRPISTEWWHFTLVDEPYPDVYFTFPVNSNALRS